MNACFNLAVVALFSLSLAGCGNVSAACQNSLELCGDQGLGEDAFMEACVDQLPEVREASIACTVAATTCEEISNCGNAN